jgi:ureidoglycolate lyase
MTSPLSQDISDLSLVITAEPLTASAFASFGDVIANQRPEVHPAAFAKSLSLPFTAVSANQGSAIKYQHVTRMNNLYGQAASAQPGQAVVNMFVCAARLDPAGQPGDLMFPVRILERHPFTPQTFVPLSANPDGKYLVVVAPSLPPSSADAALPVPAGLPGRGLPDLRRLRAFVASTRQAVTYGAGTWHAPMVAMGKPGTTVDYVVVQFANGVAIEDCQEVAFTISASESGKSVPGVVVRIPATGKGRLSKL